MKYGKIYTYENRNEAKIGIGDSEDEKKVTEAWNKRPNPWHTGTPTEEGWYLIAFTYEFEEGVRYTTDYFKDGKWAFPMVRDVSKLRAWQKVDEYKGEK